jgi:hypothetical protein
VILSNAAIRDFEEEFMQIFIQDYCLDNLGLGFIKVDYPTVQKIQNIDDYISFISKASFDLEIENHLYDTFLKHSFQGLQKSIETCLSFKSPKDRNRLINSRELQGRLKWLNEALYKLHQRLLIHYKSVEALRLATKYKPKRPTNKEDIDNFETIQKFSIDSQEYKLLLDIYYKDQDKFYSTKFKNFDNRHDYSPIDIRQGIESSPEITLSESSQVISEKDFKEELEQYFKINGSSDDARNFHQGTDFHFGSIVIAYERILEIMELIAKEGKCTTTKNAMSAYAQYWIEKGTERTTRETIAYQYNLEPTSLNHTTKKRLVNRIYESIKKQLSSNIIFTP